MKSLKTFLKESLDEASYRGFGVRRRTMKTGPIKGHPHVGRQVEVRFGEHAGKRGVVTMVDREPTFSQMVPYKTTYSVKHADDSHTYHRKEHLRFVKEAAIDEAKKAKVDKYGSREDDPMRDIVRKHKGRAPAEPTAAEWLEARREHRADKRREERHELRARLKRD